MYELTSGSKLKINSGRCKLNTAAYSPPYKAHCQQEVGNILVEYTQNLR